MPTNSPDAQAAIRADVGREVERVSTTSAKHLDDLIGNARWFTTLAIAEIAGLWKFAEGASGWKLVVVDGAVLLLALSVGLCVFAIRLAQSVKNKVQTHTAGLLLALPTLDLSESTPADMTALLATLKEVLKATSDGTEQQARLALGLMLFLVGSIVAGIALFLK